MNNAVPALLALLVVLSLPVGFAVAAQPDSVAMQTESQYTTVDQSTSLLQLNETTNRLMLTGDVQSEYETPQHNVAHTLALTDDELRLDHEQQMLLEREFENASRDERIERVEVMYDRLDERKDAVEVRERKAVRAHATDELSTAELVTVLVRNQNEAVLLHRALDALEERDDQIGGYSLREQGDVSFSDDQNELELYRSQLRTALRTGVTGERTLAHGPDELLIETADVGFKLSALNDEYMTETTRFDHRNKSQPMQFSDITDAYEYATVLYPWALDNSQSPSAHEYTTAQLYRIHAPHSQGDLVSYIDGGSAQVYHEQQRLPVADMPWAETNQTTTGDGMELSLNLTHANGPVEVTVRDEVTGEPIDATILIEESERGTVDEEGVLWVLPPHGEYEITAQSATGQVNTTVTPN